jgi:hypothetical protein
MIILFDALHFKPNTIILHKTTLNILKNKIPNVESKHPIYIILPVFCLSVHLSVWHSIDSAPGRDTDLKPVPLEPAWPEPAILGKNFPEKWPVAKLPKKNVMLLMLFYGKNIGLFVLTFEKQSFLFILSNYDKWPRGHIEWSLEHEIITGVLW